MFYPLAGLDTSPPSLFYDCKVSNEELDLIFAAFDTTGDGEIDTKEYGKLLTQSAASLTSHSGGNSNPKSPP